MTHETRVTRVLWGHVYSPNANTPRQWEIRSDCTTSDIYDEHCHCILKSTYRVWVPDRRTRSAPPALDRIHRLRDEFDQRLSDSSHYMWVARQQELAMDAEGITGATRMWHGLV
jgi:hypothetical protein